MSKHLRRLRRFSLIECFLLCQLLLLGVVLSATLRFLTLPSLASSILHGAHNELLKHFPLGHRRQAVESLVSLASIAARILQGPDCCLLRSLLLFWLFAVRRESVELCIGVKKEEASLHGHAWIEQQGRVLVDGPDIAQDFTTLLRFAST